MNRPLLLTLALGVALAASLPSCTPPGKLSACQPPDTRMWCRGEVIQSTKERVAAGLGPVCRTPFVATKCVDAFLVNGVESGVSQGGLTQFTSGLDKLYTAYSAPSGWPPYVIVGDNIFAVNIPLSPPGGGMGADCITNGQNNNPWPSYPVADLDAAKPLTPGLTPQGLGGSSGGGGAGLGGAVTGLGGGQGISGLGGGPSEGGDCAYCLANAPCDGLTQSQCITMHCAAVCPWDSSTMTCEADIGGGLVDTNCAPSGATCSGSSECCAGLYCIPSDVGSTCST